MVLGIEFGSNNPKKFVTWNKDLSEFPKMIRFEGRKYEWIMFEAGTGFIDHELKYGEVLGYHYGYFDYAIDFSTLIMIDKPECECGAIHTSFPQLHMIMCKLWKPWDKI